MGTNSLTTFINPELPVELYREIFSLVFKMEVEDFEDLHRLHVYVRTPLILGSVCQRWRNMVLDMPLLWTFIYCKPSCPEAKTRHGGEGIPLFPELTKAQSMFLERSADMPLRICILVTKKPEVVPQAHTRPLDLFPARRIRQITIRIHDLNEAFISRGTLFFHLLREVDNLVSRLLRLPALKFIDVAGNTFRRSTRAIFHRQLSRPADRPKLLELAIHGEEKDVWLESLKGSTRELTKLTLSKLDLPFSRPTRSLFRTAGPSLTHLELANLSWAKTEWERVFQWLENLKWLKIEQTRSLYEQTTIISSDLGQAGLLQRALLDILPNCPTLFRCLQGIELLTNVPLSSQSLLGFTRARLQCEEAAKEPFRVVVSQHAFTHYAIASLREVALVEIT